MLATMIHDATGVSIGDVSGGAELSRCRDGGDR
jgi:hypothetical protein